MIYYREIEKGRYEMNEEYRNEVRQLFESLKVLYLVATDDVFGSVINLETFIINEYLNGTDNHNADRYLGRFYAGKLPVDDLIEALTYPKESDVYER